MYLCVCFVCFVYTELQGSLLGDPLVHFPLGDPPNVRVFECSPWTRRHLPRFMKLSRKMIKDTTGSLTESLTESQEKPKAARLPKDGKCWGSVQEVGAWVTDMI